MMKLRAVTILSIGATVASAQQAVKPVIVNVGDGCTGQEFIAADLTDNCGYDAANPCKIYKDGGTCSETYTVALAETSLAIHAVVAGTTTAGSDPMELPQKAWHALCPYQCGGACVTDPTGCVPESDYIDSNGNVAPGSTTGSTISGMASWIDSTGSDSEGSIGTTPYVSEPPTIASFKFASGMASSEGSDVPQTVTTNMTCGATKADPCLVAGPVADECYEVTVVTPGLDDSTVCSGQCPTIVTTLNVKVVHANQALNKIALGQSSWGQVCPVLCRDSGKEVCVDVDAKCVQGTPGTKVPDDTTELWDSNDPQSTYTLLGSMSALAKPQYSSVQYPCDPTTTTTVSSGNTSGMPITTTTTTTTTTSGESSTSGSASSASRTTTSVVAVTVAFIATVAMAL